MEEGRDSQGWWRGEGVNLLGDKKNRKRAAEPIIVNSKETTETCRYLNQTHRYLCSVSNTQPGHTCTWRLAPLGSFSGRCHACSTSGVVHCLHHTVVHWCHWTTIQDCQWNPCMMVMLVQHVRMQYCSYNEHSAGHCWYCTVNLFN